LDYGFYYDRLLLLNIGGGEFRFPVLSSKDVKAKENEQKEKIDARIFNFSGGRLARKDLSQMADLATAQRHLAERDAHSIKLLRWPADCGTKACMREPKLLEPDDAGYQKLFCCSEQWFLSLLGEQMESLDMAKFFIRGEPDAIEYDSIEMHFYNVYDMCHYCRGIFSSSLTNPKAIAETLFNLIRDKDKPTLKMSKTPKVDIFAHSYSYYGKDRNEEKGDE
jgi:hypothetical protein